MNRTLTLPSWGPYSRHYMGISKLVDGAPFRSMIDFTFVPGYMRGRAVIPDVNYDCEYHPWTATPDYAYYAVRYDLQGKDTEYCHAEYFPAERGYLLKLTYTNHSDCDKEYFATCFAVQRLVQAASVRVKPGEAWLDGADYQTLDFMSPQRPPDAGENYEAFCHLNYLNMGHDGLRRGVTIQENLVNASGLGNRRSPSYSSVLTIENNRTFLMNPGTRVIWRGDGAPHRCACLRFSMANIDEIELALEAGAYSQCLTLRGDKLVGSEEQPALALWTLPEGAATDTLTLRAVAVRGGEKKAFLIDGLLLTDEEDMNDLGARFIAPEANPRFCVHRFPGQKGVALTTDRLKNVTVAMFSPDERPVPPPPYSDCSVTNVYSSELSGTRVLRKLNNDAMLNWGSHNCQLYGDGANHFSGYHAAPIVCRAGESRSVYMALVCDEDGLSPEKAIARAAAIVDARENIERRAVQAKNDWLAMQRERTVENPYAFGQERLMCNLLGNVTYPVYIKDGFYRTFTPGKRWGGLFTWDSGMLGIGLAEYAPQYARQILCQYFADADDQDIDAVLHGTQLPLHIYLLFQLYQRTGDKALLREFYPGAKKYYRYFAGMGDLSRYDKFCSGLLCPFEDGYNVEGIDDYPPQHYAGLLGAYDRISPACTGAHAIRTGKLMALMAAEIGEQADIAEIENWNKYLENALQTYSWDEQSGYFSYVWNDTKKPLYYDEAETVNFNMGIDGASPIVAGILSEQQLTRVMGHLTTPGQMWTPFGITAVDMTAPYARRDGYWNGKVWIPHQWFFYKALITEGEPEAAVHIARTALDVWEKSVRDTYNCYEQFCSVTGMGEGCHNFGGLSAPIAAFYFDLYEKGRVTAGFDSLVRDLTTSDGAIRFTLSTPARAARTAALVCVGEPGVYRVRVGEVETTVYADAAALTVRVPRPQGDVRVEITRA